jgi:hypothetical protein
MPRITSGFEAAGVLPPAAAAAAAVWLKVRLLVLCRTAVLLLQLPHAIREAALHARDTSILSLYVLCRRQV